MIVIKAATHNFTFDSDGCYDNSPPPDGDEIPDYCASGIGTGFGEAWRECDENGQEDCHAISHSEFYTDVLLPTSTPTETGVPPSPTPTETDIPPSPTPTETSISSPTPTQTGVPPSQTPTSTVVIPTETQTPTPTGTPIAVTVTPTQTELPPGSASPTATGTLVAPTATPTVLGTEITPTSTQPGSLIQSPTATSSGGLETPAPTQATLPPPPVTGTQPAALIPVTGVDLSSPLGQLEQVQHGLINLGLALLGMGLIIYGIGKRIDID